MRKSIFLLVGLLLILLIQSLQFASSKPKEFLSITLYNTPVDFGNMDPGQSKEAVNDPLIVSIDSNIDFDISVKADNNEFKSKSNSFSISNLQWNTINFFPGTSYTRKYVIAYAGQTSPRNYSIYHRLTIPPAQTAGDYDAAITISASKASGLLAGAVIPDEIIGNSENLTA